MKLGIVIPSYQESVGLNTTLLELEKLYSSKLSQKLSSKPMIIFIDDGSTDDTWNIIGNLKSEIFEIHGLRFSKNFGHQAALIAGLEYVVDKADVNICIDADLQHDIDMIPVFLDHYSNGFEIVYGVKRSRGSEKLRKKILSLFFYKILRFMGAKVIENHADFRLMGKISTIELLKFRERNIFLRGIVPTLGFKTIEVYYDVKNRQFGESKYTAYKMLALALNGITSFSIVPLRIVSVMGLFCFFLSGLMGVFVLLKYFQGVSVPGWASTLIPIYFLGGMQLLGLGILGEYAGKIYLETKKRPLYIVEEIKS